MKDTEKVNRGNIKISSKEIKIVETGEIATIFTSGELSRINVANKDIDSGMVTIEHVTNAFIRETLGYHPEDLSTSFKEVPK